MAQRVSGKVKTSGVFQEVLFPSHVKAVIGLIDQEKITRSLLPVAGTSVIGAVKISDSYNPSTPANDTVLSQKGAKDLYQLIQNLESPLDYIGSNMNLWNTNTSLVAITTAINNWVFADYAAYTTAGDLRPGHAVLVRISNSATVTMPDGHSINTQGSWLYIYNGSQWIPSIDFPEVPFADDSGANESAMIAGLITKAMLWKLKGIQVGAQVNTVNSVAGKTGAVTLVKSDVGLGNADNTADNTKNVLSATKLTTPRTIAGVSFDGTGNIAIPFANVSSKPSTLAGYGITDAQALHPDLTAITGLVGTAGILRKTAVNTWTLDTAAYLTAITKAHVEAVLTGTISSHAHPAATSSARGTIQLATSAEAIAATNTEKALTPSTGLNLAQSKARLNIWQTMPNVAEIDEGQIFLFLEETIA